MDWPLTTTIAAIKTQTRTCSQKSIHQNFNHDATHIAPNRSKLHFYQPKTPFAKNPKPTATTRPKLRGIPTPNRHGKAPPMSQPLKNQLWGKSWGWFGFWNGLDWWWQDWVMDLYRIAKAHGSWAFLVGVEMALVATAAWDYGGDWVATREKIKRKGKKSNEFFTKFYLK